MNEDPGSPEPQSILVEVSIQDPAWTDALPPAIALAEEVVRETLVNKSVWELWPEKTPACQIEASVCFASNAFVQDLNKKYRDKDRPTNVLSFPSGENGAGDGPDTLILGDIVLAREIVEAEAERDGKSLTAHTSHLLIHGTLHLLGHTHDGEADAEKMESLEADILAGFGLSNPYTYHPPKGQAL